MVFWFRQTPLALILPLALIGAFLIFKITGNLLDVSTFRILSAGKKAVHNLYHLKQLHDSLVITNPLQIFWKKQD
jgi:hypothetical protein